MYNDNRGSLDRMYIVEARHDCDSLAEPIADYPGPGSIIGASSRAFSDYP
jgi:hypothetical protein